MLLRLFEVELDHWRCFFLAICSAIYYRLVILVQTPKINGMVRRLNYQNVFIKKRNTIKLLNSQLTDHLVLKNAHLSINS
jgi:hypothetical protein